MRKILLTFALCALLAAPAAANPTFWFTQASEVLGFSEITDYTYDTDGDASYEGAYLTSAGYGAPLPAGHVGLVAHAVGRNVATSGGTIEWIGLGATGIDLTGYTGYAVTLSNDNDDIWKYKLFVDDGTTGNQTVSPTWTQVGPSSPATLYLAISGYTTGSRVGIMIGSDIKENTVHTSILIPAPGAILLGGIGVCLVGLLRRRRTL